MVRMPKDTRLWRAICQHLGDMEERNLDRLYVRRTENLLGKFASLCQDRGIQSPTKITPDVVGQFMNGFEGLAASTQRCRWAAMTSFLKSTGNVRALKYRYKITGRDREVRWLTQDEVREILRGVENLNPREQFVTAFGLLMGLRGCQVRALTVGDLKMALRDGKNIHTRPVKRSKGRKLPLHPFLAKVAQRYLTSLDLPDSSKALPVSRSTYERIIRKASRAIGVDYRSHELRRTFATMLHLRKIPLQVIRRLMCHTSIATTDSYLNVDTGELMDAVLQLESPVTVQEIHLPVG